MVTGEAPSQAVGQVPHSVSSNGASVGAETAPSSKERVTHHPFAQGVEGFVQGFTDLVQTDSATAHGLYYQLREPEAYLEAIQALAGHQATEVRQMQAYPSLIGSASIRVGSHLDSADDRLNEQHNFTELPASLVLVVEQADSEIQPELLVRWVDSATGEVVSLELVPTNGMGGRQVVHTYPTPEYDGAHYRVDVFDASEGLALIGSTSVAITSRNREIALPNVIGH